MPKTDLKNKKPVLIIIAGPNGSGKTSITQKILDHHWVEGCEYINPDNIAKEKFGDWNSPKAVLKAAKFATKTRYRCLKRKQSLIFETVLSSQEKIDFIQEAKKQDYFVRLFFINTESPDINAKRVALRVLEGGHDVPITKIISRYSKSLTNGYIASKMVDKGYFYDNSIDDKPAELILKTNNGKVEKEYRDSPNWLRSVRDNLV
jgi:predicted ABC-type ATPase